MRAAAVAPTPPAKVDRFVALDSMRGLFACLVALYHLKANSWIANLPIVRGGWLFVDFFFVLSGFVIAAAYRKRLAEGFAVGDFMWLRLGRVYPLHLFILFVLLTLELALAQFGGAVTGRPPFEGPKSIEAFIGSVALIHIFGLWPYLVWNGPSWSIAAEVWTYLLYALLARFAKRWHESVLVFATFCMIVTLLSTGNGGLDRTYDFSMVRCILSFALGALSYTAYRRIALDNHTLSRGAATGLELATGGLTFAFVATLPTGPLTLVALPLFLLCLLVYAFEGGWVSKLLATAPFQLLGTLSYSIYMTHALVETRLLDVFYVLGRFIGVEAVRIDSARKVLALEGIVGELATIAVLVAIIAVSYATFVLVENPCRRWSRMRLDGLKTPCPLNGSP